MQYLRLFHGRTDLAQDMDDWGTDGPVFGPYDYIHTTYACHVKMGRSDGHMDELRIVGDMIYYDGCYYGDWSVFDDIKDCTISQFDSAKAEPPEIKKRGVKIVIYVRGGLCQDVITNLPEGSWEYALVDYDNEPELPDDYVPYSAEEMKPLFL